jgi:tetratricopeptide (TPR) repeat protein
LALREYLDATPTAVVLVNAAATCFNLGALSKKLHQYKSAAAYFVQAQEIYDRCIRAIRMARDQTHDTETSCEVCLYQLIVETLHARAHLHYKHQKSIDDAIECHEEVLRILEQQVTDDRDLATYRVKFVRLADTERRTLLIRSLQTLGKLYVDRGDIEDGLIAYQQTMAVIREFGSENAGSRMRLDELAQIIKKLSNMNAMKPTTNVSQLQRLARMEEDSHHWEQALAGNEFYTSSRKSTGKNRRL